MIFLWGVDSIQLFLTGEIANLPKLQGCPRTWCVTKDRKEPEPFRSDIQSIYCIIFVPDKVSK